MNDAWNISAIYFLPIFKIDYKYYLLRQAEMVLCFQNSSDNTEMKQFANS